MRYKWRYKECPIPAHGLIVLLSPTCNNVFRVEKGLQQAESQRFNIRLTKKNSISEIESLRSVDSLGCLEYIRTITADGSKENRKDKL